MRSKEYQPKASCRVKKHCCIDFYFILHFIPLVFLRVKAKLSIGSLLVKNS